MEGVVSIFSTGGHVVHRGVFLLRHACNPRMEFVTTIHHPKGYAKLYCLMPIIPIPPGHNIQSDSMKSTVSDAAWLLRRIG